MLRLGCLVLIVVQNSSLIIVTSISRMQEPPYLASVAVFFSEVLKLGSAVALLALEQRSLTRAFSLTARLLSEHGRETLQFAVPALCYTLQNNLWFYALSNLDPVTAAVTSQVKVITTAIASVVMLGRRLNGAQWLALLESAERRRWRHGASVLTEGEAALTPQSPYSHPQSLICSDWGRH